MISVVKGKQDLERDSESTSAEDTRVLELVSQAQNGDQGAFEELVFLHREAVWRIAFRSTRDMDAAMDIVQDVFVRAWRALAAFSGRSRFSTWLYRVTVNVCVDHARIRYRQDQLVQQDTSDRAIGVEYREGAGSSPRPDQAAIQAEFARRLETALMELSDRQREAFMLRYMADLPISEVAETMKCSEGAVKRHLFRATNRLKEILG